MSDDYYAKSSEAKALHAIIDDDPVALKSALSDYSRHELIELAIHADNLAALCREAALLNPARPFVNTEKEN